MIENMDRTERTTEVLKLQLDNAQQKMKQLQVDNQKFQAEVWQGEEQSAETEVLRHRLLNIEEEVIGAEQEEAEKLSTALA